MGYPRRARSYHPGIRSRVHLYNSCSGCPGEFRFTDAEKRQYLHLTTRYLAVFWLRPIAYHILPCGIDLIIELRPAPIPASHIQASWQALYPDKAPLVEGTPEWEKFYARLLNPSSLLHHIQQQLSVFVNTRRKRTGPLWRSRFKSVRIDTLQALVEGIIQVEAGGMLAGLVVSPGDDEFSSWQRWLSCVEDPPGLVLIREMRGCTAAEYPREAFRREIEAGCARMAHDGKLASQG